MEEAVTKLTSAQIFNSPLETGVRSVVILDRAYPRSFDLRQLTWLDHLVVHTGDFSETTSLHPNVAHRDGELLVRRKLVEQGINLMRRVHLVEAQYGSDGITYSAAEGAGPFVQLIRTDYGKALKERAEWLVEYLSQQGDDRLHEIITEKIGR